MYLSTSKNESTFSHLLDLHIRPPKTKDNYHLGLMRSEQVTSDLIRRLGCEKELKGHQGCVNCLEWSPDGALLASGSDDCSAIVWEPHLHRRVARIPTGHTGNIFSVNFMPHSGNATLVSGAADSRVIVSDVTRCQPVCVHQCHSQRVKRLATARDSAFLFWSASEDGTVRQFDLRDGASANGQSRNVLVDLSCLLDNGPEAKCVSLNPCRSEMLAVGANDHCVRLFDRRMLGLTRPKSQSHRAAQSSTEAGLASETPLEDGEFPDAQAYVKSGQYYIPGHLTRESRQQRRAHQIAVTYVTFSPDGRDLVANLGGEQVYTARVIGSSPQRVMQLRLPWDAQQPQQQQQQQNGYSRGQQQHCSPCRRVLPADTPLPAEAQSLKTRANAELQHNRCAISVRLYTEALHLAPDHPVLLANRAAALLKRAWAGDAYAAALDCEAALSSDPDYYKALYRLGRAFADLGWTPEARQCVAAFEERFPEHAADSASFKELAAAATAAEAAASGASQQQQQPPARRPFRLHEPQPPPRPEELELRSRALDLRERFVGHCNTTTDIKEANFFGANFLVAGSDEGNFFVWDRRTGALVRAIKGDESIVNCLQPHPSSCLLATSGIDPVVRLWSPQSSEATKKESSHECSESQSDQPQEQQALLDDAVARNQRLMRADPLELMLRSMGYRLVPAAAAAAGGDVDVDSDDDDDEEQEGDGGAAGVGDIGDRGCRTS